jgi:hypothetical protein
MADDFYASVPVIDGFASLADPTLYVPLPPDWVIGLTDVVSSTEAIAAGSYKTVNVAGAAIVAAIANKLEGRDFPFVFGGDGATFALPGADEALAHEALAATAAWVRDDLGLTLRPALMPVSAIRAAGHDVRVARFAPSPNVSYAMFSGGGLAFAEAAMKGGAFALEPGLPGDRPDLSGLSCRFQPMPATRGVVLSLIVVPAEGQGDARFRELVLDILGLAGQGDASTPVPVEGPGLSWPPEGLGLEARATRRPGIPLVAARLGVMARTLASHAIFSLGLRVGGFDPARYRRQLVENADFRKFDDGLRMTIDCTPTLAETIEKRLAEAEQAGVAHSGLHRQDAAIMTCFVPSPLRSDHIHFVDGAAGGYAAAAAALKQAKKDPDRPIAP